METFITDGIIHNLTVNQAFTVQLNDGTTPQISPTVDFEFMPIKVMAKLAFDALKVRGRGAMRNLGEQKLKTTYTGKVSWRALYSKTGAQAQVISEELSGDELDAKIKELQAKKDSQKDDLDKVVDDATDATNE